MPRPKKDGRRDVLHVGGWANERLRSDAEAEGASLGELVSELLETFYAHLDMRCVDLSDVTPSTAVNLRLSSEARRMLDDICTITGVRPSSALNMILLWAYLTHEEKCSITD